MQLTAQAIANLLHGTVEGDPDVQVSHPSRIENGSPGSITFLADTKYEPYAYTTKASVLLVEQSFEPQETVHPTLIRVQDVRAALVTLFQQFGQKSSSQPSGISDNATIRSTAQIGENSAIGDYCMIEEQVRIGANCIIHPQVFIGKNVTIGDGVLLYPGVRIYHDCVIGDNCIVHANAVIGSDGFGYAPQESGSYQKIIHVGHVHIEHDVEIGANTVIDRATIDATIIREGVKLDNLVQVGHNVEIGKHTVIAAQTGIAGSTKIGANCQIGGQVGFSGHLKIADGTMIQAQSGIAANVQQENTALFGSPAIGYKDYIRSYAVFKKLPDLYKQINRLEQKIKEAGLDE